MFEREPLLAILDVLTGGALARSSVLALGVMPYLAGWLIARITYGKVEQFADELRRRRFTYAYCAVAAVCMGSIYLYLLSRIAPAPVSGSFAVAGVASLTAGSLLFAWLAELVFPDLGLRFFVAANVLAAAPAYVIFDLRSAGGAAFVLVTLSVALAVHAVILTSARRIPIRSARRVNPRLIQPPSEYLPVGLDPSGLIALLFPLVALGLMRMGSFVVAGSKSRLIRWLAGTELQLTDARTMDFWLFLFVLAVPINLAFNYSAFNPADIALTFKKEGAYIPGIRPGRNTESYLRKIWAKVAWAGPLTTMLLLEGTALLYYGQRRTGLWPIMLAAVLSTVKPVLGFVSLFEAIGLTSKYRGFFK